MCMGMELGPVTYDLGDMTLTLCVSDSDGSNTREALADLVSVLVFSASALLLRQT